MTERKVKQLLQLLTDFRVHKIKDQDNPVYEKTVGGMPLVRMIDGLSFREQTIVSTVRQWVLYYGRDELNMDL